MPRLHEGLVDELRRSSLEDLVINTENERVRTQQIHDDLLNRKIIPSPFRGSTQEITTQILRSFNGDRRSMMTRGFYWFFSHFKIPNDSFVLVEKNGIPELVGPTSNPIRRMKIFNLKDSSSTLGTFKQSDAVIGANGSYIINVPPRKYAKIYDGNQAKLLGEGQHVIHSNNFRFNPATDIEDQFAPYIQHNDIHIINVLPMHFAKVYDNNEAKLLGEGQHFIQSSNFRFNPGRDIIHQNDVYFNHNKLHVLNVPAGQYAKVYDNNEARTLGEGRHVIESNNFRFNPLTDLVSQNDNYIHHNNQHILRVPQGKVAIVRLENQTMFLEHRKDPYVFTTLQFNIIKNPADDGDFYAANSKVLHAGTQLRLIPDVGEIGIVNSGGRFRVIEPKEDQAGPMLTEIGSGRFDGFLATSLQNVEFPSAEVKQKHLDEGESAVNSGFDYYYTADPVKVGVRFLVNYRIINPDKTLEMLNLTDIKKHIESVVTADMGSAIKQTTYQNLLSSDMSSIKHPEEGHSHEDLTHWQDKVKTKLKVDLAEYGIELVRLNIEEAKILNDEIERQMSQKATVCATAHADRVALAAQLQIKQAQAEQNRTLAIQQQEMTAEVQSIKAKNEVETAKLQAEAQEIATTAEVSRQMQFAGVLQESPQAMMKEFLGAFVRALQGGNFSSALPLSDLSSLMATFMDKITGLTRKPLEPGRCSNPHSLFGDLSKEAGKEAVVVTPRSVELT